MVLSMGMAFPHDPEYGICASLNAVGLRTDPAPETISDPKPEFPYAPNDYRNEVDFLYTSLMERQVAIDALKEKVASYKTKLKKQKATTDLKQAQLDALKDQLGHETSSSSNPATFRSITSEEMIPAMVGGDYAAAAAADLDEGAEGLRFQSYSSNYTQSSSQAHMQQMPMHASQEVAMVAAAAKNEIEQLHHTMDLMQEESHREITGLRMALEERDNELAELMAQVDELQVELSFKSADATAATDRVHELDREVESLKATDVARSKQIIEITTERDDLMKQLETAILGHREERDALKRTLLQKDEVIAAKDKSTKEGEVALDRQKQSFEDHLANMRKRLEEEEVNAKQLMENFQRLQLELASKRSELEASRDSVLEQERKRAAEQSEHEQAMSTTKIELAALIEQLQAARKAAEDKDVKNQELDSSSKRLLDEIQEIQTALEAERGSKKEAVHDFHVNLEQLKAQLGTKSTDLEASTQRIVQLQAEIDSLNSERADRAAQLSRVHQEKSDLTNQLKTLTEKSAKEHETLLAHSRAKESELREEASRLQSELDSTQTELQRLKDTMKTKEKEYDSFAKHSSSDIEELKRAISTKQHEIDDFQRRLVESEKSVERAHADKTVYAQQLKEGHEERMRLISQLEGSLAKAREEREAHHKDIADMDASFQSQLAEMRERIQSIVTEKDNAVLTIQHELKLKTETANDLQGKVVALQAQLTANAAELGSSAQLVTSLQASVSSLTSDCENRQQQLNQIQQEREKLQSEIRDAQEKAARESSSFQRKLEERETAHHSEIQLLSTKMKLVEEECVQTHDAEQKKAEKLDVIASQLHTAQDNLAAKQAEVDELNNQLEELRAAIESVQTDKATYVQQLKDGQEERMRLMRQLEDSMAKAKEERVLKAQELQAAEAAFETRAHELENRYTSAQAEHSNAFAALERELVQKTESIRSAHAEIDGMQVEITTKSTELEAAARRTMQLQADIVSLTSQHQEAIAKLTRVQQEKIDVSNELKSMIEKISHEYEELSMKSRATDEVCGEQISKLQGELSDATNQITQLVDELKTKDAEFTNLAESTNTEIEELKRAISTKVHEGEELQRQLNDAHNSIERMHGEKAALVGQLKDDQEERLKMAKQVEALVKSHDERDQQLEHSGMLTSRISTQLEQIQMELTLKTTELSNANSTIRDLRREMTELQQLNLQIDKDASETRSKHIALQQQMGDLESQLSTKQHQFQTDVSSKSKEITKLQAALENFHSQSEKEKNVTEATLQHLRDQLYKAEASVSVVSSELEQTKQALTNQTVLLQARNASIEEFSQLSEQIKLECGELQKKLEAAESETVHLKNTIQVNEQASAAEQLRLNQWIASKESEVDTLESSLKALSQKIADSESHATALKEKLRGTENQLTEARGQCENLQLEANSQRSEMLTSQSAIVVLTTQVTVLTAKSEAAERRCSELTGTNTALQTQLDQLNFKGDDLTSLMARQSEQITELSSQLVSMSTARQQQEESIHALSRELEVAQESRSQVTESLHQLQQLRDSEALELGKLQSRELDLNEELLSLQQRQQILLNELQTQERAFAELKASLQVLQAASDKNEGEFLESLATKDSEIASMKAASITLHMTIEEMDRTVSALREKLRHGEGRFSGIEDELAKIQIDYNSQRSELLGCKAANVELTATTDRLLADKESIETRLKQVVAEHMSMESQLQDATQMLEVKHTSLMAQEEMTRSLQAQVDQLTNRLQETQRTLQSMQNQSSSSLVELQQQLESQRDEIEARVANLQELRQHILDLEEEKEALSNKLINAESQIARITGQLEHEKSSLKSDIAAKESEIILLKEKLMGDFSTAATSTLAHSGHMGEMLSEKDKIITLLQSDLNSARQQLFDSHNELNIERQTVEKMEREVAAFRTESVSLNSRLREAKSEYELLLRQLQDAIYQTQQVRGRHVQDVEDKNVEILSLRGTVDDLERQLKAAKDELNGVSSTSRQQVTEIDQKTSSLLAQLEAAQLEISTKTSQLVDAKNTVTSLASELESYKIDHAKQTHRLQECKRSLEFSIKQRDDVAKAHTTCDKRINTLQQMNTEQQQKISSLLNRLEQAGIKKGDEDATTVQETVVLKENIRILENDVARKANLIARLQVIIVYTQTVYKKTQIQR
jgi:chromosome segregation ATPase